MKITIASTPGEEEAVGTVEEFFRALWPDVKIRKSERHPPFKHTYLTTKKAENPCNSREKA